MSAVPITQTETRIVLELPASVPDTVRLAFAPVADLATAEERTRHLAHAHYENFSVVSLFVPRALRQDFCNIYAFCRVADDLGDEVGDPAKSLELLAAFKRQTRECYAGHADTAVFVALGGTIRRHDIPIEPFLALIEAFEQDQRVTRYDTFEQVVDYCRRSADPVGRLVLYLYGYRDAERQRLSDLTCTALQLTNFWQDVRRDLLERDRIYLPRDSMRQIGIDPAALEVQIREGRCDERFRRLIELEVERSAKMFDEGERLLPLLRQRCGGRWRSSGTAGARFSRRSADKGMTPSRSGPGCRSGRRAG